MILSSMCSKRKTFSGLLMYFRPFSWPILRGFSKREFSLKNIVKKLT
jgi:hypothetical protein